MKRSGILHADLARHLAALGHSDRFLVVDSGFPTPERVPVVDLRLVYGVPQFSQVVENVLAEIVVERAVMANEAITANAAAIESVARALSSQPLEYVSHQELKLSAHGARFVVRTAEATPYANVVIYAGVAFDV